MPHSVRMEVRLLLLLAQVAFLMQAALSLSPDGWALLHFRSRIEHDPDRVLSNWNAYDKDPCKWFGVHCNESKVTRLNLTGNSLRGILAPELGQLTNLRELLLRDNFLMGAIPFELGELERLEVLDLACNRLTGELPHELGNLSSLTRLYLENNDLEGNIPPELGDLRNIRELRMGIYNSRRIIPGGALAANAGSSYGYDCFASAGVHDQRSSEEDLTSIAPFFRRRLLETDGSAGAPLSVSSNDTSNVVFSEGNRTAASPAPSSTTVLSSFSSPATAPDSPAPSPAPAPDSSAPSTSINSPSSTSSSKAGIVAVAISLALLTVTVAIVLVLCYRHKGAAVRPWKSSMSGELQKGFVKGVPAFSREELENACEDFSNIIGFSPDVVLFKGTLENGVEIAVTSIRKSAKSWSNNSELIFWTKVECLSQMKHQNLVNLLGYCAEEEPFVRMLVFEYVPNGTVHEHLHNKESEQLDWTTRMRVITGVAYALEYMHHVLDTPVTLSKLDTKSVYLAEDFSAKVADFGVWKASSLPKDFKSSSEHSNAVGHDDLELSDRLAPVLESNVHDFGVFLLEMISGRPAYSKEWGSLSEWAMNHVSDFGEIEHIVDPNLQSYNSEELTVVGSLALQCIQSGVSRSLTMQQVAAHLSSSLTSVKEPFVPKSSPLLWAELEILSQD